MNAAEAAFELNDEPTALPYINRLRQRAGFPANSLTSLTIEKIQNERRVEMCIRDSPYANDNPEYINNVHENGYNPAAFSRDIAGYKDNLTRNANINAYAQYDFSFGLKMCIRDSIHTIDDAITIHIFIDKVTGKQGAVIISIQVYRIITNFFFRLELSCLLYTSILI